MSSTTTTTSTSTTTTASSNWSIYTIGHNNFPIEKFFESLKTYKIATLVDIRAVPYSKKTPEYGMKQLSRLCIENSMAYEWKGNILGGKHRYAELIKTLGYEALAKVLLEGVFRSIKHPCVLLCGEWNVNLCHRKDICEALLKWNLCNDNQIQHIWMVAVPDKSENTNNNNNNNNNNNITIHCKNHTVAIEELPKEDLTSKKDKEDKEDKEEEEKKEDLLVHVKLKENEEIKFDFSADDGVKKPSISQLSKDDLVVTSSTCIIPDERIWEPIQEIRKNYDKSYTRWMPHINLLYPFVPDSMFESHSKAIEEKIKKNVKAFDIEFSEFDYFDQQPSHKNPDPELYLFLVPKLSSNTNNIDSLQILYDNLIDLYPACHTKKNNQKFHPHLTVAQFKRSEIQEYKNRFAANWKPISFRVTHVNLISRPDFETPFSVKIRIPLGE